MNLDGYLRRIDYTGDLSPTLATLDALHAAHATHIPFENLDVLLGRGVQLDLETLERKLVAERRGGYCFEQNLLFATVLEAIGFEVTLLSARVRLGATGVRPRTHMVLLVTFPAGSGSAAPPESGGRWIADVGFGTEGLLRPVPFAPAAESVQFHWTYRVVPEGPMWVMQSRRSGQWVDLYVFSLDAHERIDYEVLNHYTATHPRSIFRSMMLVSLPSRERRVTLQDGRLTIETGAGTTTRPVADDELLDVLRETFSLEFPAGTTFPIP